MIKKQETPKITKKMDICKPKNAEHGNPTRSSYQLIGLKHPFKEVSSSTTYIAREINM